MTKHDIARARWSEPDRDFRPAEGLILEEILS